MSDIQKNELLDSESEGEDFVTCFFDLKEIERYKDSSFKMSRLELVLSQHLNFLKIGVINGEFTDAHIANIKRTLNQDKLTNDFPNLRNIIEDFFSAIHTK